MQEFYCTREHFHNVVLEQMPPRTRYGKKPAGNHIALGDKMSPEEHFDPINHPRHYTQHPSGVECIQITRHMNFNVGNAIKYLWRHSEKNGIEDLKKARWYIDDEIKRLEK